LKAQGELLAFTIRSDPLIDRRLGDSPKTGITK